jgi:glycogen debranching enzyme
MRRVSGELMALDGAAFFLSDVRGDVSGMDTDGFFDSDVRHLSLWEMRFNGEPLRLLRSGNAGHHTTRVFGTLAGPHSGYDAPVSVWRLRQMSGGVFEEIRLENHTNGPQWIRLEIRFDADFADIFEVRYPELPRESADDGERRVEQEDNKIRLSYEHSAFRRSTELAFDRPFDLSANAATFAIPLEPKARADLTVEISTRVDDVVRGPAVQVNSADRQARSADAFIESAPLLETDSTLLESTYEKSLADLAALRFCPAGTAPNCVPAAGLPWFMALFGRDSLITAYQALPFAPGLAEQTLRALAVYQSDRFDDFTDAEPGKVLHELRTGKLAALGRSPQTPYYGTHDATCLWLILLDEYERWSGDRRLAHELKHNALRALEWIEGPGDLDGDGYLEYQRRSSAGLHNQCWKDSPGSMVFADGRRARGPIATSELQGYAYDARLRTARLAREVWADGELARRLERDATALKARFNLDFWSEERDCYVLALDGDKRPVDSMASNVGHLLWSGIIDDARAPAACGRLMTSDMFNGWGTRTLSANDAGFNPIGYHTGTVWPHDTVIVAEGLRRAGRRRDASRLVWALLEAGPFFDFSLPEVFAGYRREDTAVPVEYPTACRPQAWAAGAPLLALRTLLGLDPRGERLSSIPDFAGGCRHIRLRGIRFRGGEAATL